MNDIKHGIRPIDANALLDAMPKSTVLLRHQVVDMICNSPPIDVAPVVHAYWIKTFNSDGFVSTLRCSECGNSENSTYVPGNFCWFCGARMDGEEE